LNVVLDASIVLAIYFPDEQHEAARRVEQSLEHVTAHVPSVWPIEIVNAFIVAERRRRLTQEQVDTAIDAIVTWPVTIHDRHPPLASLVGLCRRHQRTAYDALYLALAIDLQAPLATLDGGLRQACAEARVPVYLPSHP